MTTTEIRKNIFIVGQDDEEELDGAGDTDKEDSPDKDDSGEEENW